MGAPIEEVADRFGHKDATTLMSIYRHDIAAAVDAGYAGRNYLDLAAPGSKT